MKATAPIREWVYASCVEQKWSKAELARELNLAESTVGRLLNGRVQNISDRTADELCRVFGATKAELLAISEHSSKNTVRESRTPYGTSRSAALAEWLRTQPKDKQDLIYGAAQGLGFKLKDTA